MGGYWVKVLEQYESTYFQIITATYLVHFANIDAKLLRGKNFAVNIIVHVRILIYLYI